jgi:hypothetical protein
MGITAEVSSLWLHLQSQTLRDGVLLLRSAGRVSELAGNTTLVEFRLEEVRNGTLLVVTESGFNKLPKERYEQPRLGATAGAEWAYVSKAS